MKAATICVDDESFVRKNQRLSATGMWQACCGNLDEGDL
jgi:hypothetical protein